MRNRSLLVALFLVALALPAAAQSDGAVLAFFQRFTQLLGGGDVDGAIRLVETQPAEAEQVFGFLETTLAEMDPAEDMEEAVQVAAVMNFLARTFQVRLNRPHLSERLRSLGILASEADWVGTPLAGGAAPAQAPPAGGVAAAFEALTREWPAMQAELQLEQDRSNFAVRLEDMQTGYRVVQRLFQDVFPKPDRLLEELRVSLEREQGPGLDAFRQLFQQRAEHRRIEAEAWRVAEVSMLSILGLYSEAAAKGEALRPQLTSAEAREFLALVLVQVGRASGQPDLVRRSLQGLQPQAARDRFYVESVRFEQELRQDPDLSAARFLARHAEVWPVLKEVGPRDFDRFAGYALRIWAVAAADIAFRLDPGDPGRAQVLKVLDADVQTLAAQAGPSWKAPVLQEGAVRLNDDWNPLFLFTLLDLHLDLAARAREAGDSARAAGHLAAVQARLPELEAAVPALEAAGQKLFAGQPDQPDVRRGGLSRVAGRAEEERGRQKGDRAAFERALALYERAAAPQLRLALLPDYALALLESDPVAARKVVDGAVAEAERAGQRAALARAFLVRGRVREAQKDAAGAVVDLGKGTEVLEKLLTELGTASPEARRLRDAAASFYDLLARLQTEAGKSEDAFATLARKGQVEGFGATAPSNAKTAPVQALRARMSSLEGERLTLAQLPDTPEVQVLRARNSELLASTRSDFYARLGELYRDEPAYQRLAIRPVVYGQIQGTLPANAVVLQYLPSEKSTYVFVLTRESMRVRRVDVSQAELAAGIQQFRARMAAFTDAVESGVAARSWVDDGSEAWKKQVAPMRDLLAKLHAMLVEPVEEDLQGKDVVAVIPTGDLMYLPFAALGRPRGGDLEFLAERKQVVTLVKASDLLQVSFDPRAEPGPVVAFGNPDGSLAAAEQEVKALQSVYPDAQVFVRNQASYEALRGVVGKVGYLHLATHGVLDSTPGQNHLVLAGVPEGRLTMREIADLQLGPATRLVTLSGCQTAMNSRSPETELLQSVADAFGFAGSPSVVASLWRVADESTRDLMVEFYRRLKAGESRAQALQGAEGVLLKDPARRHPFYWAPFVLIGDWR